MAHKILTYTVLYSFIFHLEILIQFLQAIFVFMLKVSSHPFFFFFYHFQDVIVELLFPKPTSKISKKADWVH